ncbi:MAG: hypothetical protein ABIG84_01490 [archaeon]
MLTEKDFVSKKAGIRIFKGSGSTDNNLNVSLRNEISFENIEQINNKQLKQHLKDLKQINEKIYAWAALTRIQKEAYPRMKIFYVIVDTKELLVFDYINSFPDDGSEFQQLVDWKMRGSSEGFQNLVFLNNKHEMQLSNEQVEQILKLLGAKYVSAGNGKRYVYNPILSSEDVKNLSDIVLRKTAH